MNEKYDKVSAPETQVYRGGRVEPLVNTGSPIANPPPKPAPYSRPWLLSEPSTGFLGWLNRWFGTFVTITCAAILVALWMVECPDQLAEFLRWAGVK